MIEASHKKWAKAVFNQYAKKLLRKNFYKINILGEIPEVDINKPLLLIPNHSSWWDGFIVYLLNEKLFNRKVYLMMLEEQLSKHMFFSKLGAYSIEPGNMDDVKKSLSYTLRILQKESGNPSLVCFFPQGDLKSWGNRPLRYKSGLKWLIKNCFQKVNLLQVGIRLEFGKEQRPEIHLLFDKNYQLNSTNFPGSSWLEEKMEMLLNDLQNRINGYEKGFNLLKGHRSVNEIFSNFKNSFKF